MVGRRSDTALGAFYRRLSSRAGKKAVTATARKIAVLFYKTLRHGMSYKDPGADHYEQQYRSRVLANLQRRGEGNGLRIAGHSGERQSGCFLGSPLRSLLEFRNEIPLHRRSPRPL